MEGGKRRAEKVREKERERERERGVRIYLLTIVDLQNKNETVYKTMA